MVLFFAIYEPKITMLHYNIIQYNTIQ